MQMPEQKPPKVLVINIKPVNGGSGSLRAFASIQVGPLIIHDCRLIRQDGQRAWVSPPQTQWTPREGEKPRYKALVEWPDHWKDAITEAVSEAYEAQGA